MSCGNELSSSTPKPVSAVVLVPPEQRAFVSKLADAVAVFAQSLGVVVGADVRVTVVVEPSSADHLSIVDCASMRRILIDLQDRS